MFFSFGVCFLSVKPIFHIGKVLNLVDNPDLRKKQSESKIRIGGLNIFFGFFLSMLVNIFISSFLLKENLFQLNFLLIGSIVIFVSGLMDDFFNLSPFVRLIFEFVVVSFLWLRGINIQAIDFSWLIGNSFVLELIPVLGLFITCFWIVGLLNAFNWIDGIDGLLTGVSIIFCIALGLLNYSRGNIGYLIIITSLLGSCIGFLFFNFKPAKIYMGDCGSNFLGFLISIITFFSFTSVNNHEFISNGYMFSTKTNIFLAIIFLAYPILDMIGVIISRIKNNKSIFRPDRNHRHHRLLNVGLNEIEVLQVIYSLNFFIVSVVLFLSNLHNAIYLLLTSAIIFIYFLLKNFNKIKKIYQ